MRLPAILPLLAIAFPSLAADYQIEGNIRYDRQAETVLDIVQPRAPALGNRPGVIMIHGSAAEGGKDSMVDRFCVPFVRRDFVVANVEYRPAPDDLRDVLNAAKWFLDHAAQYKVAPERILVAGEAEGGRLALLAAMLPAAAQLGPGIRIAAAIDFYGSTETLGGLSPAAYARKGMPPILAIHGDADGVAPYEQSAKLTKALKAAGSDAELLTVPGGKHGLTADEMEKLWPQIFRWLKKHKIGS